MSSVKYDNSAPEKLNLPEIEESILQFWRLNNCFHEQLKKTSHLPRFTFYDGPPFATGTPHYGHIAAGTIKDVICRYATQKGYYVERRFGWDCHGLPVEYEIDKTHNIKDRKQVLEMGIKQYNQLCRGIVMKYSKQWESVVQRFGRWIDFRNDYKTMDITFMESVWSVFKVLYERGLVYRGRRIMPYSNAVATVLSNFEVQLNYKDTKDPSVYLTMPIKNQPEVGFIVWTTTPWTLPSNLALAVHPEFIYIKIKDLKTGRVYILAEKKKEDKKDQGQQDSKANDKGKKGKEKKKPKKEGEKVQGEEKKKPEPAELKYEILGKFKGSELEGLEYVPPFNFFPERAKDGCFRVLCGEFVTSDVGTGIVHCAPGFGDDDYKLCVAKKIISPDDPVVPLDENGKFTSQVPQFAGIYVKDADPLILDDLSLRNRLIIRKEFEHSYPFCWRSDTPLIYKAISTWFIKVTAIKEDLVQNNFKAEWVPKNIQEKRFDTWLREAQDWCFSRSRFWGNPIPLWISDDGQEVICVGSVKELEELTGSKISDLHRENIDHLTIDSKQGRGKLRRIDEVFDCWFESGSMPFAQVHYPFSTTEEQFKQMFPADFIGEGTYEIRGIDQTRGWFYTLNVISTGVKNLPPYKNLIVNGLVLTEDGKKMSKRLKNYPDPIEVVNEFGADAVRLYLMNSPLVRADNLNFSKDGVRSVVKDIFLPWYNAFRFLVGNLIAWEDRSTTPWTYSDAILYDPTISAGCLTALDSWLLSNLQQLIRDVRQQFDSYKLYAIVPPIMKFLENLTNIYVRISRPRLKGDEDESSCNTALTVLFDSLLKISLLMDPIVPFLTQYMYQNLKMAIPEGHPLRQESIHYLRIPEVRTDLIRGELEEKLQLTMEIIETARTLRESRNISVKWPVTSVTFVSNKDILLDLGSFVQIIKTEVNVLDVLQDQNTYKYIKLECLPNLPELAKRLKGNKNFGSLQKKIKELTQPELQAARKEGSIVVVLEPKTEEKPEISERVTVGELIIQEKLITEGLPDYLALGGGARKTTILLDTRQTQELRLRGYVREFVNRVQKLKKKCKVTPEDSILIFYDIPKGSKNLEQVLLSQLGTISSLVKKPLLKTDNGSLIERRHILGKDKGTIEEEDYSLAITSSGPIFIYEKIKADFPEWAQALMIAVLEQKPFDLTKATPEIIIRTINGPIKLLAGQHYFYPSNK